MMLELPAGFSANDFMAIEAAVMETVRGRWFLAEYARRRRAEDSALVVRAINRLEASFARLRQNEALSVSAADQASGLVRQLLDLIGKLGVERLPELAAQDGATRNRLRQSQLDALAAVDGLSPVQKDEMFR